MSSKLLASPDVMELLKIQQVSLKEILPNAGSLAQETAVRKVESNGCQWHVYINRVVLFSPFSAYASIILNWYLKWVVKFAFFTRTSLMVLPLQFTPLYPQSYHLLIQSTQTVLQCLTPSVFSVLRSLD